jgi:hypothetical protein
VRFHGGVVMDLMLNETASKPKSETQ